MASFSSVNEEGSNQTPQKHELLKQWFIERGGKFSKVEIAKYPGAGYGLQATEDLEENEPIVEVPFHLCITTDGAKRSWLSEIISENKWLEDSQDELLALFLMAEKDNPESEYAPYLRCLPTSYDTPLFWTPEERAALAETSTVGLLTNLMNQQIKKDWTELHAPLAAAHSRLAGLTEEKYRWALATVYSRAFGFVRRGRYTRALAPVMCFVNHHPEAATELDDVLEYDEEQGALRMRCGKAYAAGAECLALYGRYSNAKLLYSYGFTLPRNPYRGVDFWLKVPASDPNRQYKQSLLHSNPLTAAQNYDFRGTLLGDGVSIALMATLRIIHLATQEEFNDASKAFSGAVSRRNEAASLAGLLGVLRRKVQAFRASAEDDQKELEALQLLSEAGSGGEDGPSSSGVSSTRAKDDELTHRKRLQMAISVRLDDKKTIQDTIGYIEQRLRELNEEDEQKQIL
mmetsp:Transcript_25834/g.40710  ORF Transcript_25834/g.40710 Transcript_25834/m.40710 type:complete len:459 (-) Transcript_25834:160-1536(-)